MRGRIDRCIQTGYNAVFGGPCNRICVVHGGFHIGEGALRCLGTACHAVQYGGQHAAGGRALRRELTVSGTVHPAAVHCGIYDVVVPCVQRNVDHLVGRADDTARTGGAAVGKYRFDGHLAVRHGKFVVRGVLAGEGKGVALLIGHGQTGKPLAAVRLDRKRYLGIGLGVRVGRRYSAVFAVFHGNAFVLRRSGTAAATCTAAAGGTAGALKACADGNRCRIDLVSAARLLGRAGNGQLIERVAGCRICGNGEYIACRQLCAVCQNGVAQLDRQCAVLRCGNGQRNHRIDVGLKRDSADNLFHADAPTAVCLQCAARYRTALEIQIADQVSLCGAHCKFDRAAFANLTFRAVIIGCSGTRAEGILCVVGRQIKQRYIFKIHLHLAVFGRSERESVGELICCRAVYRPRLNHLTGIRCGGQRQRSTLGYLNAAGGVNGRAIRAFNGQLAAVTADGRKRYHLADAECCVNGVVLRHVVQVECQRVASCCAVQRPAGQICAAARLCGENNRRMVRNGQLAASNSNVCTVYLGGNRATAADIDGDGVCRNRHKADINRGVAGQRVNDIGCALLRTDGSGACRVCVPVFDHIARIGYCRKRNARTGFCLAVCVRTGNGQRAVVLAVCRKNAVGYGVFRVCDFVARNDFGVLGDGQGVGRCIGFVHRAVYLPADEGVAACRCGRGERDFGIALDRIAACQRLVS